MKKWSFLLTLAVSLFLQASVAAQRFIITEFGAIGSDSTVDNAKAIQEAVSACANAGGGEVVVPNGAFYTSTFFLANNVFLHLEPGAVLYGAVDTARLIRHAATLRKAVVVGEGLHNTGITGTGTIHGRGEHRNFFSEDRANGMKDRPNTISFAHCTNLLLRDFTMRNGSRWCIVLKECDNVNVDNIKVISRVVANNDGLDITDCHYTRVSNSYFDCGDDAICPKSESSRMTKYLTVTNCIVKSESNAIKFGAAGVGGFSDVTVGNCVLYDTRLSGLALELVDGGTMERLRFSNIVMHRVNGSIFVKLGHRSGEKPGIVRNIHFADITADAIGEWLPDTNASYYKGAHDRRIGITVTGLPDALAEDISFQNIRLHFAGGGKAEDAARSMPEAREVYPEYTNFGITPAYAFSIRNVSGLSLNDVTVSTERPDSRPAISLENVHGLRVHALVEKQEPPVGASPVFLLKKVRSARITDCTPYGTRFFLDASGCSEILLQNNDFSRIQGIHSGRSVGILVQGNVNPVKKAK